MLKYSGNAALVAAQTIDQETVIIHFGSGRYYHTDAVGAALWEGLEAGASLEELVERLAARYTGDRAEMTAAVAHFLEQLQAEDLIVAEEAVGDASPLPDAPVSKSHGAFSAPVLDRYTDMADLLLLDPVHEIEDRRPAAGAAADR
jgi:hypothetical protein